MNAGSARVTAISHYLSLLAVITKNLFIAYCKQFPADFPDINYLLLKMAGINLIKKIFFFDQIIYSITLININ